MTIPYKKSILAALFVFFCVFVWLRFHQLTVRPFHNDEAVNAWFFGKLVKSNEYKYDPNNYHGPSLYYLQLIPTWMATLIQKGPFQFSFSDTAGITDFSIRAPVAVTGLLILLSILLAFNRLGPWGAASAFLLAGFSCNGVYFSRYFIHETFFVLFALWIYLGAIWYRDTRKPFYFYLMVLSSALLFSTKETSVITFFVMGFSVFCAEVTHRLLSPLKTVPFSVAMERSYRWFFEGLFLKHVGALAGAIAIWFLLYTSFFKNYPGLADSIRTYMPWTKEGIISGHAKPFSYFIWDVLVGYELGIVILAAVGLVLSFIKREKTGLYLSFWAMGTLGAYSLIPYKTVWCVITILLPMILLAGFGVQKIAEMIHGKRALAVLVLYFSLIQIRQTYRVVFVDYDKEHYEPPYVHTSRDVFNLLNEIERLAQLSGLGTEMKINVFSETYWPLPYYLRDYPHSLYWDKVEDTTEYDAPLLVVSADRAPKVDPLLKDTYLKKEFTIRPAANVNLYINTSHPFKKHFPPPAALPTMFKASRLEENSVEPGLHKYTFQDRRPDGNPISTSVEKRSVDFSWATEDEKTWYSPFAVVWEGFLEAPRDGRYDFSLESDDGSQLWIDDFLVVDNQGSHAALKKTKTLQMQKGKHRVRLEYFDVGGEASLRWTWVPPGGKEEPVPASLFFHKKAGHEK